MNKRIYTIAIGLLYFNTTILGQHTDHATDAFHGMKGNHRLTLGLGHTSVSKGEVEGSTQWLAIASWSVNYDYWLSDRWAIGLQNDFLLESFVIEHDHQEEIERAYPWAIVPVALYKPGKHFTFIGGVGWEYSHTKTLTMTRLGVEYGWHLPKNWEVGAALVWDNKWDYYNSWGIAFTASKIF